MIERDAITAMCAVMADYRMRRLRWMKDHPEQIGDGDDLPEELSREAEARAILTVLSPT